MAAEESDIAPGPTEDGGYYLVGLRHYVSDLFNNIALSTPLAYEQTIRTAAGLNLRILKLPRWYDVDTASDLRRLHDEIFTNGELGHKRQPLINGSKLMTNDTIECRKI